MVNLILNIIWLIMGGLAFAAGWFVAALIMVISIVGIPFARAAINMGLFALWPFGRKVIDRSELTGEVDVGTGRFGVVGNIVWLLFAGFWLAIAHLAMAFGLAVTIIGIPFAWQHMKFSGFAIWPIGRAVVDAREDNPTPFAALDLKPRRDED